MSTEDILFVEVRQPIEAKRDLLESMKGIVEAMHRYERFKSLRQQKHEKIQKLEKEINNVSRVIGVLRSKLPVMKLKKPKHHAVQKQKKDTTKAVHGKGAAHAKIAAHQKEPTELDRLEAELKSIEGRLKGLQ